MCLNPPPPPNTQGGTTMRIEMGRTRIDFVCTGISKFVEGLEVAPPQIWKSRTRIFGALDCFDFPDVWLG